MCPDRPPRTTAAAITIDSFNIDTPFLRMKDKRTIRTIGSRNGPMDKKRLKFLVLALVVTALFGTGFLHLLFAVAAVWWVPFARLARSITLSSGNDIEVAAARVLGASGLTIAVHEILPKVTGPAWVLATFELGKLILSLSALSFFGLGAKPPSPEWGTMLADAKVHFFRAPHLLLGPALFIFLTVLSLNLMGEGLRDRLDPFEIPGF